MTAVRPAPAADAAVASFLREHGSDQVARRGELVDATAVPALVAGDVAGVLTYLVADGRCEILTLHAAVRRRGIGSALVAALDGVAAGAGCGWLDVLTTNDNVDALRFYQRRGFAIRAVRPGAVEVARRTLKPGIPVLGDHGIPIRDEIELTRPVRGG